MRALLLPVCFALCLLGPGAYACTIKQRDHIQTPKAAFENAEVVIHARVLSREQNRLNYEMKVEVLQTLKGTFSGDMVFARNESICGPRKLEPGKEYVFFFEKAGSWKYGGPPYGPHPWNPESEANEILNDIRSKAARDE
jgi:hypothetical protein